MSMNMSSEFSSTTCNGLKGKTALISGGGKGIGKGIALALARQGVNVAIGCNANPGMAEDTLKELRTMTDAILIPSDVSTPEGCQKLIDETVKAFNGLDILVSNAAIQTHHSVLESNQSIFRNVLNINLRAAMLLMNGAYPHLKASGAGRVIMISSVHGKRPTDFDAAYAVSKGGMEMLCREAAIAYGKDMITVNIIAPGGVQIEGKTGNPKPFSIKPIKREKRYFPFPMGRWGLPSDIAAAACFLASPDSEHISGTTIRVDGCSMLL
ncbi:glucose 1-dehydrogenase [Clostridia bacterium]|nr:glucose 1-dehydrogenase [Clostridia bacterium]